jgi:hypothetical protein
MVSIEKRVVMKVTSVIRRALKKSHLPLFNT